MNVIPKFILFDKHIINTSYITTINKMLKGTVPGIEISVIDGNKYVVTYKSIEEREYAFNDLCNKIVNK